MGDWNAMVVRVPASSPIAQTLTNLRLVAVAFRVGDVHWEVGASGVLNAFFSTISGRLEPDGVGTRFPTLMRHLYTGSLNADLAEPAIRELANAREELRAFPPEQVIWDLEDPAALPPWGVNISADIADLASYFVTSDGLDLITVLHDALAASQHSGQPIRIE